MDPQKTFEMFCDAVREGNYEQSADLAESYNGWIRKGGFSAKSEDLEVVCLDIEQDRYGLSHSYDSNFVDEWQKI